VVIAATARRPARARSRARLFAVVGVPSTIDNDSTHHVSIAPIPRSTSPRGDRPPAHHRLSHQRAFAWRRWAATAATSRSWRASPAAPSDRHARERDHAAKSPSGCAPHTGAARPTPSSSSPRAPLRRDGVMQHYEKERASIGFELRVTPPGALVRGGAQAPPTRARDAPWPGRRRVPRARREGMLVGIVNTKWR